MRHDHLPARDAVLIVGLLALSSLVAVARAAEHEECTKKKCSGLTRCQRVNGIETCICPRSIAFILDPICGSNGKSYGNKWELAASTCHLKDEVKVAHQGYCNKTSDPCSTVDCGIYQKCEAVGGKATCVRAECPERCPGRHFRYHNSGGDNRLCGYDGKTYENLCMLRKENCPSEKYVIVKHKGECQKDDKSSDGSDEKPPRKTSSTHHPRRPKHHSSERSDID